MDEAGVRWTPEQVLALASDAASRTAGNKLGVRGPWSTAGSSDTGAVWGLCKGSGKKPYQTVIDTTGPAYKCSCPSRKFPCKHALGLLLLWTTDEEAVRASAEPDWAEEWLSGRRSQAERGRAGQAQASKTMDPEAARRRAERRAERITAGALELEQRLTDLLRGGLAAAEQSGYGLWEETAARMVDAQAPGLASRVRELGAIPGSGAGWPVRLLEECSLVHLLDSAWMRIERLPEPLAMTVRTRVGLPSAAGSQSIRDRWLVLSQYDSAETKITTRRIWVYGRESEHMALLLSFGAAGRAPQLSLPVGTMVDAELTPHLGAGQLRAELGAQFGIPVPMGSPPPGGPVASALEAYGRALSADPWLDSWPATLAEVIPVPDGEGWQLADAEGGAALPIASAALSRAGLWRLASLSGGRPITVFGECGPAGVTPLAAWSGDAFETVTLI
ncbi:SWIM zinc finger family protein [Streptomyces albipurpureus]|uniref:SWIM zinc finger domain-containing protein n=1 Tax=Streptomyces albipurpureus TaxID=2897419 RepID=A0ABT0UP76_9ACTN|nr:SWIM zinc finger family protein [Streptomyces sp. CWNU-1]MCM2389395.1 SWIM zinc finger domain-containing protein [Streptomyces sp. CWNU-1]